MLRMYCTGNEEWKWSFLALHIHTYKHHAHLYNSPPKIENRLYKKRGMEVAIFSRTHTHTQTSCTSVQLTSYSGEWIGQEIKKGSGHF